MEHQQKILENNLKKFLDLKQDFLYLQKEAEESDRVVDNFLKVKIMSIKLMAVNYFHCRLLLPVFPHYQNHRKPWTCPIRTLLMISVYFKVINSPRI